LLKRGFTLVELLVALGLLAVVLAFVFDTFTFQHATYSVVDQISEAQQNSRAIARLIERDIRNAGYLVPPGAAACGVDETDEPDALFLSDTDAILPADQLPVELAGDDLGAETTDDPGSTGSLAVGVDDVVVDGTASYDVDGDGTNDSDFRVGGGAILVDVGNPDRGVSCGLVTAVDTVAPASVTVNFLTVHSNAAAQPKDLVLVPGHVYRIVPASDPPRLERNGVVLAKDVEDFQVAWFYDDDEDGEVDDPGETRGVVGTAYATNAVVGDELREIRINLVLRTRADDSRNPDMAGTGQARENRTTAVPGDDGKHRRVHTATVRLRNLTL
jgi:prepilin-type N-terminal cleavage/methylation domain-containing protein